MALEHRPERNLQKRRRAAELFFPERETEDNEFSFRLEDELTPERVQEITDFLAECKIIHEYDSFIESAAPLVSFSVLVESARSLFDEEVFQIIRRRMDRFDRRSPTHINCLRILFVFYPQRSDQFFGQEHLKDKKQDIGLESDDIQDLYKRSAEFFLLAPERRTELPLSEQTTNLYREYIELLRNQAMDFWRENQYHPSNTMISPNFLLHMARAVLLHPDVKLKLSLDKEQSDLGKFLLESSRSIEDWKSYLEYLESISILAAREVRVPSPGRLEFTFPPTNRLVPTTPLPAQKEY